MLHEGDEGQEKFQRMQEQIDALRNQALAREALRRQAAGLTVSIADLGTSSKCF